MFIEVEEGSDQETITEYLQNPYSVTKELIIITSIEYGILKIVLNIFNNINYLEL